MSYATPDDLLAWCAFYDIAAPPTADRERLLELATADVVRHLGARFDQALVLPEQATALTTATAIQACFRAAQGHDAALGVDDGLSAIGPLSFSFRQPPRLSPEAADVLAGIGLFVRSGTVDVEA